jgi:hypothetical protein
MVRGEGRFVPHSVWSHGPKPSRTCSAAHAPTTELGRLAAWKKASGTLGMLSKACATHEGGPSKAAHGRDFAVIVVFQKSHIADIQVATSFQAHRTLSDPQLDPHQRIPCPIAPHARGSVSDCLSRNESRLTIQYPYVLQARIALLHLQHQGLHSCMFLTGSLRSS